MTLDCSARNSAGAQMIHVDLDELRRLGDADVVAGVGLLVLRPKPNLPRDPLLPTYTSDA